MKADLEAKVAFLKEENWRAVVEGANSRKVLRMPTELCMSLLARPERRLGMPSLKVSAFPESKCRTGTQRLIFRVLMDWFGRRGHLIDWFEAVSFRGSLFSR